jgi:Spy/CpxP family protein refolding chaperone
MKKVWQMIGIGLLTTSLISTTNASAQQGPGGEDGVRNGRAGGPGRGRNMCNRRGLRGLFSVLRAIDITEEQQTQITTIRESYQDSFETMRTNTQAVRQNVLDQLLTPGQLATDFVAMESAQLGDYAQQRISQQLAMLSEVRAVLTDTQLAEAADLIESRQALCHELREMFGNPDGNPDENTEQ